MDHTSQASAAALSRPLTGRDELTLDPGSPWAALDMVARLAPGMDVQALDVTTADRLVAQLYGQLYGDVCDCRTRCVVCGEAFGFELSLRTLIEMQDRERPRPDFADGSWSWTDGRRVRAPRIADLTLTPEALLERLVISGGACDAAVLAFLERAAPILTLDLAARCPHCGTDQEVRFDLARYLIQRLAGERPFLLREVHLIAARYGWSFAEILDLSRDDRRALAGLIAAEPALASRRAAS
ncbi:hypothetical protein ABC977_15810 [Thioalkalicoccus limnaeus]|uniref:NIF system FeS cluster assembly NifU C-terminal domain-containing protein n=1 Tax=Thioalkalicoccus limnaeus TaxID=120681 RepID=A0ABV4BN16_9GAMM